MSFEYLTHYIEHNFVTHYNVYNCTYTFKLHIKSV